VLTGEFEATLRRVPLFAGLPRELLAELVGLAGKRTVARGELLFAEGDPAGFLPVLLSGQVKLFRLDPEGRERLLHLVRGPASFGEAAAFGPGVFPANAEAVSAGELLALPRRDLIDLLRRRPEVALALIASMAAWLRRLVDLVEGLSLRTVEERVAAYLWSAFVRSRQPLQPGTSVRLNEPKYLIAAVCGTVPEVLSRTFRKLEVNGAVRIHGPNALLLDPKLLHDLAHASSS